MTFCSECGKENAEDSKYCSDCGNPIKEQLKDDINSNKQDADLERKKWLKRIITYTAVWGVLNLLIASPLFGGILIFFAILIYASKSFMAVYAFGVVWLLLALLQLVLGAYYVSDIAVASQGYLLIVLSFINFGFGGWAIYNTKKLESNI